MHLNPLSVSGSHSSVVTKHNTKTATCCKFLLADDVDDTFLIDAYFS
jgi:hypothetical protein